MQALRDAGIALVVILLLVSVRLTPLEETEAADASLTPRTEASAKNAEPAPAWVEQAAPAAAARLSEKVLVLEPSDADDIEYCTQVMFRLQAAEKATHEHDQEAEEVIQVLACSA
mgnify:CR=1 FL=1